MVLEKTLESPVDNKEIKRKSFLIWSQKSNPKGFDQKSILKEVNPEYSLEVLMLKLKLQYFGHLIRANSGEKDPDVGKDWREKEKKAAEDEMVGWHHQRNEHESEQTLGYSEGQRSLACCSPWVSKRWTWLNDWTTTATLKTIEMSRI